MRPKKKRRLTVYPGQVSMVLNMNDAEQFLKSLESSLESTPNQLRPAADRFLFVLKNSIATGHRLRAKQSATDHGNI
jgi:hypothetical protein